MCRAGVVVALAGEPMSECEELKDKLARIEAFVAPQWRHTEGEEYSKGRNDAIDAVRAILGGERP